MNRDEAFWRGLMLPEVHPVAAESAFQLIAAAMPKALHPKGPPNKPVPVVFNVARDADHILYKAEGDTHGRQSAMSKRPEEFQADRAGRVNWIVEVLADPEAV